MKKKLPLVSLLFGFIALVFFLPLTKTHADVTVTNDCTDPSHSFTASINADNGKDVSSDYYKVTVGQTESWRRNDPRGHILAIVYLEQLRTYYTPTNAAYSFKDGKLYSQGSTTEITPLKVETNTLVTRSMNVNMINLSTSLTTVSLSKWKSGGSTDYFTLNHLDSETWSRNDDPRGFLVSVLYNSGFSKEYIYYLPSIQYLGYKNFLTIRKDAIYDWDETQKLKVVNVIDY